MAGWLINRDNYPDFMILILIPIIFDKCIHLNDDQNRDRQASHVKMITRSRCENSCCFEMHLNRSRRGIELCSA